MSPRRSPLEIASWAVLGLLLLLTLIGAARLDRAKLPLLGDEATYAMQAASLAHDFDLTYTRHDYDRFVADWGVPPEGLILQSRPGGDRLVYAKPPLYALVLAPFVAVAPVRGPVVANALLLAAAALLAARALRRRIGPAAPLWVAAFVYASAAFAYVFWGESDLFVFAAVAAGFALVYGDKSTDSRGEPPPQIYAGEDTVPARAVLLRWLAAGALLGIAVVYRPVYLVLLVPAFLAAREAPADRRMRAASGLALGALAVVMLSMGVQWLAGGDPTGYGGQRQGIYSSQSFPEVAVPAARWSAEVARQGSSSWLQAAAVRPELNLKLAGWNVLYTLVGRDIGILPFFLPLLLGFLAFQGDRGRWTIPLAVAVALLAFLVLRPFNFFGGGPLGNRYFLPLYPALWFVAGRRARSLWAPAFALLAAPFLLPLWSAPTAYPIAESGEFRAVSDLARRWLPYETTQASAPGQQAALGNGLWVKLLDHNVWPAGGQGESGGLRIAGASPAHLLLGSPKRLKGLDVELDKNGPSHLRIGDNDLRPVLLEPNGSVVFEIAMGEPRAVHPLWWGAGDYYLYDLEMQLPGAKTVPIGLRMWPAEELIQTPWMKVK